MSAKLTSVQKLSCLQRCRNEAISRGMDPNASLLAVDTDSQMLAMIDGDDRIGDFPISTSRHGLGEWQNSFKTPRGFHEIADRIGDKLPAGSVFEARVFTGVVLPPDQWRQETSEKILTRILRLAGKMDGFNAGKNMDSYERMIYLHGTNQEQYVGVHPSSQGCIRMKNKDIIMLFDTLGTKPAWCWIGSLKSYDAG